MQPYLVTSAFGSWSPNVPPGMVGVYATLGGDRSGTKSVWLLPLVEYTNRDASLDFAVCPDRHIRLHDDVEFGVQARGPVVSKALQSRATAQGEQWPAEVPTHVLAAVLDMAKQHINELAEGIRDGDISFDATADLAAKQNAVAVAERAQQSSLQVKPFASLARHAAFLSALTTADVVKEVDENGITLYRYFVVQRCSVGSLDLYSDDDIVVTLLAEDGSRRDFRRDSLPAFESGRGFLCGISRWMIPCRLRPLL